jgi:hypothetical protein
LQESFKSLLKIVGDEKFRPEDIRHTNWGDINNKLADLKWVEEEGGDAEWMDADAGWKRTPVRISVPFHSRTRNPGPKDYIMGDLYHRSLVAIICEKLRNTQQFHYQGFELLWKCTEQHHNIRVYGEVYMSTAFLKAQREIQESQGEPGCDLPRVVAAMMFWSDATHLTSFGNTKLWPLYLFFRNDSKYQQCKPSCNLCEHVAYFQTVSYLLSELNTTLTVFCSSLILSKTSLLSILEPKRQVNISWLIAGVRSYMRNG